jgi:hypothetical protein
MLDVDMASLDRWGGRLRSSSVPFAPATASGGRTGVVLSMWTTRMRDELARLNADMDRFGSAVSACAHNYQDVA